MQLFTFVAALLSLCGVTAQFLSGNQQLSHIGPTSNTWMGQIRTTKFPWGFSNPTGFKPIPTGPTRLSNGFTRPAPTRFQGGFTWQTSGFNPGPTRFPGGFSWQTGGFNSRPTRVPGGFTRPTGGFNPGQTWFMGGFTRPTGGFGGFTWPTGGFNPGPTRFPGGFSWQTGAFNSRPTRLPGGFTRPTGGFNPGQTGFMGGFTRPTGGFGGFTRPTGGLNPGPTRFPGGFSWQTGIFNSRPTRFPGGYTRPSGGLNPGQTGFMGGFTRPTGGFGGFTRPTGGLNPGPTRFPGGFSWQTGAFNSRPTRLPGGFTRPTGGFNPGQTGFMGGFTRPTGGFGGFTRPTGGLNPGPTRFPGGFSWQTGAFNSRPTRLPGGFTRPTGGFNPGQTGFMGGFTRPTGGFGGFTRPTGGLNPGPTRFPGGFSWQTGAFNSRPTRFPGGYTRPSGGLNPGQTGFMGGFTRPTGGFGGFTWPTGGINPGPTRFPGGFSWQTGGFNSRPTRLPGGFTRPTGGFNPGQTGFMGGFTRPTGGFGILTRPTGGLNPGPTRVPGGFPWQTGGLNPRPTGIPGGFTRPTGGFNPLPTGTFGRFTRPTGGFNPSRLPGGFSRPTGGLNSGPTRIPGITRPTGGINPGPTRAPVKPITPRPITLRPPAPPTNPNARANLDCPRNCQFCRQFASSKPMCMSFDDYGDVKADFKNRLTQRQKDALQEAMDTELFRLTAYIATCDGLLYFIGLWMKMTARVKSNLIQFIQDPTQITKNEMEELPRAFAGILNETVEANMYSLMSDEQNKTMCLEIDFEDCIVKSIILRNIDCKSAMMSDAATMTMDNFLALMNPNRTRWTNDDWNTTIRYFSNSLDYDDYELCPIDVLIDRMKDIGDQCDEFDQKTKDTILNRTTEGYDRIKSQQGTVPQDVKDDWKYMVGKCGGSVDFFASKIDAREALQSLDFKNMDVKNKMATKERLFSSFNISTMDKTTIKNSITLMVRDSSLLDQLDDTKLEDALGDICETQTFEQDECRQLLKRVRKVPAFADASTMDASKVDKARCLMQCYPPSDFDSIPQSSIQSAISSGDMKNMNVGNKKQVDKIKAAALAEFNKPNGDFSSTEVEKIGPCLLAFGPDALDKIPSGSFTANVSSMIEEALNAGTMEVTKAVKAKLAEKVKASRGIAGVLASKNLASSVSVADIANAQLSDFTDLTGDSAEVTLDVDAMKAGVLMKKIKSTIGSFSSSNFTLKRFKNLKKLLSGMTTADIKNLTEDNSYLEKLHVIADAQNMNREQIKTAFKQFTNYTRLDTTDETTVTNNTDSTAIDKMSTGILVMHSNKQLKKYGRKVCRRIIKRIAKADTKLLTKTEIQDKFSFILECLNKKIGKISKDVLDKAGKLVCGLTSDRFKDLLPDGLESYISYLDKYCPLDEDERSKLASASLSTLQLTDTSRITDKNAAVLGSTMTELSDSQLDKINATVLSSMASSLSSDLKTKNKNKKKRNKAGFKRERSEKIEAQFKKKVKRLAKMLLRALSKSRSSGGVNSGRRKRSTTVYTCAELQSIGTSGLSALSTAEIEAFADSTFTDCAETLGSVTDWSTDQKSSLITVAKRNTVWGQPSTWSNTNVYSAGTIIQGLDVSEIETLTIDLDAISRLGQFSDGWTDYKIGTVFQRYLHLNKNNDSSTITSSELRSFGELTCGATTDHIMNISSSVYQNSADAVGDVTTCQDLQLVEFARLAKTAYGSDVSTWDTSTISTVGVVIGGLSKTEIASLSELQINAIAADDFSYIPPTAFSGFTVSQINTFSTSQAQATTNSQVSALSADQVAALEVVAGMTLTSDTESAALVVIPSKITACLVIMVSVIMSLF